ncbi:MAG TPA: hypothetical protein VIK91_12515 [Nannocystis sp.]
MKLTAWLVWAAALAALHVGCTPPNPVDTTAATETTTGDSMSSTGTTGDPTGIQTVTSEPTTTGDPATTTTGEPTTGSSSTTAVDVCAGPSEAFTDRLLADSVCEVLLHFDETAALLGFSVVCGATGETFMIGKSLGDATSCCTDSPSIYPTSMGSPFYVLHYVNQQGPNGVGLVSNHTGRVVLDALTGPGGAGPFTVPAQWEDPAALAPGMGCGVPGFSLGEAFSFDLGQDGKALAGADLEALAAAIGDTVVANALGTVALERVVIVRTAPEEGGPAHDFVLLSTVSEAG